MTLVFDPFTPLFPRLGGTAAFTAPADVIVGDDDLVLTMDLPGLTSEDLEIDLVDGYLSVRGERRLPEVGEGTSFVHTERPFGAFERRIKLPDGVDPDSIMARMDNGVLSLIVPKPERLKARSITIGTSSEHRARHAGRGLTTGPPRRPRPSKPAPVPAPARRRRRGRPIRRRRRACSGHADRRGRVRVPGRAC